MYKHLLAEGGGIEWMALIPLIIFCLFFLGLILFVLFGNKAYFHRMAQLPFQQEENHHETHE